MEEKVEAFEPRSSIAAILPQEILALVISFGQLGHVCKLWRLASFDVASFAAYRHFAPYGLERCDGGDGGGRENFMLSMVKGAQAS